MLSRTAVVIYITVDIYYLSFFTADGQREALDYFVVSTQYIRKRDK